MHAVTVHPRRADSLRLESMEVPRRGADDVLVEMLCVGVCGTDREIIAGKYGWAPPGEERLVIGHESLARVLEAPAASGHAAGDIVAGIVRRPDPVPCACCAAGEWDLCTNGLYTERGIKAIHGYAAEQTTIAADFVVRVDPALGIAGVLTEPASVVAKAWEGIERIAARTAAWRVRRALVTGAGPVGLLAALLGTQRDIEVHVYDRVRDGIKPELVRALGAEYRLADDGLGDATFDAIIECTGASAVIADVLGRLRPNGILCLTGVSSGGRRIAFDLGATNREMVLENHVVFGSVNANRRHYEQAAAALARADHDWLHRLVARRVPLADWRAAFEQRPDDVKTVLDFRSGA